MDKQTSRIARAIVHLNFNEPELARDVLLEALSDINFDSIFDTNLCNQRKENSNGSHTAAA